MVQNLPNIDSVPTGRVGRRRRGGRAGRRTFKSLSYPDRVKAAASHPANCCSPRVSLSHADSLGISQPTLPTTGPAGQGRLITGRCAQWAHYHANSAGAWRPCERSSPDFAVPGQLLGGPAITADPPCPRTNPPNTTPLETRRRGGATIMPCVEQHPPPLPVDLASISFNIVHAMQDVELVIVGSGPSGYTAAVYAARAARACRPG
jgi:hypothetical protein